MENVLVCSHNRKPLYVLKDGTIIESDRVQGELRTANKDHTRYSNDVCGDCGKLIKKGQKYVYRRPKSGLLIYYNYHFDCFMESWDFLDEIILVIKKEKTFEPYEKWQPKIGRTRYKYICKIFKESINSKSKRMDENGV